MTTIIEQKTPEDGRQQMENSGKQTENSRKHMEDR